jgi:hypothetical protein
MRSTKSSQRRPSSAIGLTGVAHSAAPAMVSRLGAEPTSIDSRS